MLTDSDQIKENAALFSALTSAVTRAILQFHWTTIPEVYTLRPAGIITGIEGNKWINKNRGTDERLPCCPYSSRLLTTIKISWHWQRKIGFLPSAYESGT
jgi:hypothetical protein